MLDAAGGRDGRAAVRVAGAARPGSATRALTAIARARRATGAAHASRCAPPGSGRGIDAARRRLDPAGSQVQREAAILVRPARAPLIAGPRGVEVAGGTRTSPLTPPLDRHDRGCTATARAVVGAVPVRYDAGRTRGRRWRRIRSTAWNRRPAADFPLALLPDGPAAGDEPRGPATGGAVNLVLDRQRFDGGFGLWSAWRRGGGLGCPPTPPSS